MQSLSGLSLEIINKHATHAAVNDILRNEVTVPDNTQRFPTDATSVIWGNNAWVSNVGLLMDAQMDIVRTSQLTGSGYRSCFW